VRYFETIFLEDVMLFLETLDVKTVRKILFNIDLAEQTNDATLFKKLQKDIWEFRTLYTGKQIRLLAFWDKTRPDKTLVVSTNGIIKKVSKMPKRTIQKAIQHKETYFNNKNI
jgi:hypothetical protein